MAFQDTERVSSCSLSVSLSCAGIDRKGIPGPVDTGCSFSVPVRSQHSAASLAT